MRSYPQERFSWAMRTTNASNSAVDWGPTRGLALLGTVELLCHEFAVPREDRVGCDDAGYLL